MQQNLKNVGKIKGRNLKPKGKEKEKKKEKWCLIMNTITHLQINGILLAV